MRFARPTLAIAFIVLTTAFAGAAQAQSSSSASTILAMAMPAHIDEAATVAPSGEASATATAATVASTPNLQQFSTLLDYAGLNKRLNKSTETYTVFAPTNDAVAKVPATVREQMFRAGNAGLKQLMRRHMIVGSVTFDQLRDGAELKTVDGETIRVARQADGTVLLNGVCRVRDTGRVTANGIVYEVDSMIAPLN